MSPVKSTRDILTLVALNLRYLTKSAVVKPDDKQNVSEEQKRDEDNRKQERFSGPEQRAEEGVSGRRLRIGPLPLVTGNAHASGMQGRGCPRQTVALCALPHRRRSERRGCLPALARRAI